MLSEVAAAAPPAVRVLAIADTDSYFEVEIHRVGRWKRSVQSSWLWATRGSRSGWPRDALRPWRFSRSTMKPTPATSSVGGSTRLGLPGSLPAPAPLPQPTIGRRLRRRLRRARSSVGQWLVGLPDLSPAPIGQPRDALSRRQFAYKSRVAKVSKRQTEDLRAQHTERTQGQSIVHLEFTFGGPSGHVTRVSFAASGGTCASPSGAPAVHRAAGFTSGERFPSACEGHA